MIKSAIISRLSDGLILCELNDGYMDPQILLLRHQIKRYHSQVTKYSKGDQGIIKNIENTSFGVFYKIHNYVVFTIIVDKKYPIKLSAAFLEALIPPFFDEVKTHFTAAQYESKLQSINSELYFIKFDRKIKQKKKQFEDPNSGKNIDRMKKDLQNIHDILKQNMSMLEGRQQDLINTSQRAKKINEESKKFEKGTKKILNQYWIRQVLLVVVVIAILYFVLL